MRAGRGARGDRRARRPTAWTHGIVVALLALGLGLACHGPVPQGEARPEHARPPDGWLDPLADARRHQLEAHLRGLDVAMVEIGYRFSELHFAGLDRSWPYATYQAEKIALALRLAIERRPKRAASARPFLDEEVPAVLDAIAQEDDAVFRRGIERLRAACMKCHVAEDVPYVTVELPERRISPVR